jgi:hypothetical protein
MFLPSDRAEPRVKAAQTRVIARSGIASVRDRSRACSLALDQFAYSGAAQPPLMDLVEALPGDAPQLPFDHPRTHRLALRECRVRWPGIPPQRGTKPR